MKFLLVVYNVDFDDDVMETLQTCCVTGYTKWDKVLGKGKNSVPKLDNAVWPGYNCALAIAVESEKEETVIENLSNLSQRHKGAGIKIYEWPLLRII